MRGLEDRALSELRDPGLAYVWTDLEQWTDCEERAAILDEPFLCEARCFWSARRFAGSEASGYRRCFRILLTAARPG